MTDDRRRKTEDRGQRAEVGGDGCQTSEVGRQRAERRDELMIRFAHGMAGSGN